MVNAVYGLTLLAFAIVVWRAVPGSHRRHTAAAIWEWIACGITGAGLIIWFFAPHRAGFAPNGWLFWILRLAMTAVVANEMTRSL